MANRLAGSLSPYLLQHADNPVNWYPWGDDAFAAARERDVPVLLSVGYAACHWCHVMAHESFEDPAIAAQMNEGFVNVKVDREERPDVDAIYMSAVQLMTGSGGWPMTVFLTPDGEPFYGGTYFPPADRPGMPGFPRVLAAVQEAWRERREQLLHSAAELTAQLKLMSSPFGAAQGAQGGAGASAVAVAAPPAGAAAALIDRAIAGLTEQEDETNGGFGPAPKFPPHAALQFLLSVGDERATPLAERTLDAMARGGLFDHLGGGFFRYSVDARWHVPHFEKMLYDNAQLLRAYARAYAVTGEERHREVAYRVLGWLEREMRVSTGPGEAAYISALDADSEGEEGKFYAWTHDDFVAALESAGADVTLAAARFGVTPVGDFEGGNVLRLARSLEELAGERGTEVEAVAAELERAVSALDDARSKRVRPASDDKVLTSWNGLLLSALAEAAAAFSDPRLAAMAAEVAAFVRRHLWRDGALLHVWRDGRAEVGGLLEDHAFLGLGLIAYYRVSLEPFALQWALELADIVERDFRDEDGGGYFNTASGKGGLLLRPKGFVDGATPSENSAAAELAWWAARYRSDRAAADAALSSLRGVERGAEAAPQAFGSALRLLAMEAAGEREVVLVAPSDSPALEAAMSEVRRLARPSDVVLQLDDAGHPLAGLPLAEGRVGDSPPAGLGAYVCHAGVCRLPVAEPAELAALLSDR